MHNFRLISVLFLALTFNVGFSIPTVTAQEVEERQEQVFFLENIVSPGTLYYQETITQKRPSCTFTMPLMGSMPFVNDVAIDPVYDRIVYCATDSPSVSELGYLYLSDVSDNTMGCDITSPSPEPRLIISSNPSTFLCTKLAVNGAQEHIYLVDSTQGGDKIFQTTFEEDSFTPANLQIFVDGIGSNFDEVKAFAVDGRQAEALFILTNDINDTGKSRLYYYTGADRDKLPSPEPVENTLKFADLSDKAVGIRFNPVDDSLFVLDTMGQTVRVFNATLDGTLTDPAPNNLITYSWTSPVPPMIGAFDFIYETINAIDPSVTGPTRQIKKVALGDSGSSEDILLDNNLIEVNNNFNKPMVLADLQTFPVTQVRGRSLCGPFQFDSDMDGLADCLDDCPADATNMCNFLLFSVSNDLLLEDEFLRHEVTDVIAQAGQDFSDISVGGFDGPVIDTFVYDQGNRVVYYAHDLDNSLYGLELQNNVRTTKATFSAGFSTFEILHLALDTKVRRDSDEVKLFLAYHNIPDNKCHVVEFDPSQNPGFIDAITPLFSVDCNGSTQFMGDLVIDQRFDVVGSTFDKRLYYSYTDLLGNGAEIREVERDASDEIIQTTIVSIDDNTLDPNQVLDSLDSIGALTINFRSNRLYYYVEKSAEGQIQVVALPDFGESLAPTIFVSGPELSGAATDVKLFYHPLQDNEPSENTGRIYVSDPMFATATDGIRYKDTNLNDFGCEGSMTPCLENASVFEQGSGTEIVDIAGRVACNTTFSLDSDNDTFPDCTGIVDTCLFNPDKTAPGVCGCGRPDDSMVCIPQDVQGCSEGDRNFSGACGCSARQNDTGDSDRDGILDCDDVCPEVPNPLDEDGMPTNIFPVCGCGVEEDLSDPDNDGTPSCNEDCTDSFPNDCGCGITDCSGISGERLTPTTRITGAPGINNSKSGGRSRKRRFRLNLKKFSGAVVNTSSELNGIKTSERNKKLKVRYRVIIQKLVGDKVRIVKRILSNKAVTRLLKLNNGKYTVRYKAIIKRKKKTVSQTNFSPSRSFNIPFS